MNLNKVMWWGYIHANGSVQVKRWLGDPQDIPEARQSPFVRQVMEPFEARDRGEAVEIVESLRERVS